MLDLPMPFFRDYSAGSLAMGVMGIEQIRLLATATVVTAVLAVPVGLGNLIEAIIFDWKLGLFAAALVAADRERPRARQALRPRSLRWTLRGTAWSCPSCSPGHGRGLRRRSR